MANLIEWYAVELKLLLNGKLPSERIDTIVKEAESHLRESVEYRMSLGADESIAASEAVEAYGKPDKVALGFLRGSPQKMWGLNPAWWASIGALVTICCWNWHWLTLGGYFDNFGDSMFNVLAGIIGVLGLALMATAIRRGLRSYRLVLLATTVAAATLSIPLISYWMIPMPGLPLGVSRFHLGRDLPNIQRQLASIEKSISFTEQGLREFQTAKSPIELSPALRTPDLAASKLGIDRLGPSVEGVTISSGGPFVVPRAYGTFFMIDRRSYVFETTAPFEDAKRLWQRYGSETLISLEQNRAGFSGLARNAVAASHGKLFFFEPDLYIQTWFGTLVLLPVFLFVDWIAARSARPKRQWPRKALA